MNAVLQRAISIAAMSAACFGWSAHASDFITGGAIVPIPTPPSLAPGSMESDSQISLIIEQQGLVLPEDILVDATVAGLYDSFASLTRGTISSGTMIRSYLLHQDPIGEPTGGLVQTGFVTFDMPILGVIVRTSGLDATDALLAEDARIYQPGKSRGLELIINDDQFTISKDRHTLSVQMATWNFIDQLRVIVAIPAPGAMTVLLIGAATGLARRRRRQA